MPTRPVLTEHDQTMKPQLVREVGVEKACLRALHHDPHETLDAPVSLRLVRVREPMGGAVVLQFLIKGSPKLRAAVGAADLNGMLFSMSQRNVEVP